MGKAHRPLPAGPDPGPVTLHATAIAWDDRGLLILGPSGAGKSALALALMAHGAALIADDRTSVHRQDDRLIAGCPPALSGLIEARGLGLLRAAPAPPTPLALAIDLGKPESDRLPAYRSLALLGLTLPLLHKPANDHFPAAILQYLKAGRREP
jgi:HPr kinase/phosphorylase